MYEEYAEQADIWLASKEAFLANEDLGVSGAKDVCELVPRTTFNCGVSMINISNVVCVFYADEPTSSLYINELEYRILTYSTEL